MSDVKVEAVEAVEAENNVAQTNNDSVKQEAAAEVIPEKVEDVKTEDVKQTETKDEDVKKEDSKDEKKGDHKGPRYYDNGVLKTSRRIDEKDFKNNSRYDPSVLPETSDAGEIRRQVEFYFSDSNLPTDNHLWGMTDGSTNLPVSIENICKFGRMKRFKPLSVVVAALRESPHLVVTGAEGQEQVSRKIPYDPASKGRGEARTVYVKGFGDEEPSSQFDIEAFFAPYGPTSAVRLRRTNEKLFKGSVFVEFDNEETADKFLTLDPKPLWKGKHELLIESKRSYIEKKNEEIREGKVKPSETWVPRGGRGGQRGRGGRGRGDGFRGDRDHNRGRGGDRDGKSSFRSDRDPDDWKKRREDDRANGFKDRNGRDGDRKGRGRGGRRDDRGPRNDRNRERNEKNGDIKKENSTDEKPSNGEDKAASETPAKTEATPAAEQNDKKRSREEDASNESPAAKKVDTKS